MEYYEMEATVLLLKTMHFSEAQGFISNILNLSMLKDEILKVRHKETGFKYYVFSNFTDLDSNRPSKDKYYRAANIYCFKIKSIDKDFMERLHTCLVGFKTEDINFISISAPNEIKQKFINELYTATPAVLTYNKKFYWKRENGLENLIKGIEGNTSRKYSTFFKKTIEEHNFIKSVNILNKKPFCIRYKKGSMVGNKFKIIVNEDKLSQDLAFMALACGLLEKNSSVGAGYCLAQGPERG